MFYTPCNSANELYRVETISRTDGNWEALSQDIAQWMEKNVAPHQLVSVSICEHRHPNTDKKIMGVVTHCAPPDQPPITYESQIYTCKAHFTEKKGGWAAAYNGVVTHINQ